MRFGSTIVSIILVLLSSPLLADVKLSVAPDISLIAVNGSEIESNSFFENKKIATLPDGKNQILVQYTAEVKTSGGFEVESSDAHVIVFTAVDKAIQLSVPVIKKISEFREFNRGNSWLLKDSSGHSVEYLSEALIKEGFQINRNYEQELSKLNESGGETSITNSMKIAGFSSDSDIKNKPVLNGYNNKDDSINLPATLLRYWYLNADVETRETFKAWVNGK